MAKPVSGTKNSILSRAKFSSCGEVPRSGEVVFLYSISGAPRRLADADLAKFAGANRHTSVCLFAEFHSTVGLKIRRVCVAFVTARQRLSLGLPTHCRTLWSGSNPWTCTEQKTPTDLTVGIFYSGAPRRIRTLNLLIRSQMLYPIEPWAQRSYILYIFITIARKNNSFFICCRDRAHSSRGTAY